MQVSSFVDSTKNHIHQAWNKTLQVKQIAKEWIVNKFAQIGASWKNNLWPTFKPFYDNRIKPISKIDWAILGGCVAVAIAITVLVPLVFGKAFFALAAIGGVTLFLGGCSFINHQVRKRHNEVAWEYVDQIRNQAKMTTQESPHFAEMTTALNELHNDRFEHLKEDVKKLEDQMNAFKQIATRTQNIGNQFADSKQSFIKHLAGFQKKLAAHKALTP